MTNDLPEAPASQTIKLLYRGVEILTTQRDLDIKMKPYLEQAKIEIDWALANGFEPLPQRYGFTKKEIQYVEGKICPKDGGRLKVIASKKDGKTYWTCENGHYDWTTKTTTGCNFITSPENYEKQKATYEKTEEFDL